MSHRVHQHSLLVGRRKIIERCNEVDIHLCITSILLLIDDTTVWESLECGEFNLVVGENLVTEHLLQLIIDGIRLKFLVLNLCFDVFFLVGLIMVLVVGTLLNIRGMNKFVECFLYLTFVLGEVSVKSREHDFGDIVNSWRESLHILH